MVITCETSIRMGYIYLQPYRHNKSLHNDIHNYFDLESLQIPVNNFFPYESILNQMKISEKIYKDVYPIDYLSEPEFVLWDE